jgi:hypothetical protein
LVRSLSKVDGLGDLAFTGTVSLFARHPGRPGHADAAAEQFTGCRALCESSAIREIRRVASSRCRANRVVQYSVLERVENLGLPCHSQER